MNLDIDFLIKFYKSNIKPSNKSEFTEQEAGAAPSGGGGKTPRKYDYGVKRGKANPIDQNSSWKSDMVRGHANALYYDI